MYSATHDYRTEVILTISTLGQNRYSPVLSPEIAHWQNNTTHMNPFQANTLIPYFQGISGQQPKYILQKRFRVWSDKRENAILVVT